MDKKKIRRIKFFARTILIILGSAILAFGTAAFLTPFNIVSGGLSGIGILINFAFESAGISFNVIDISVWVLNILLLILSLVFLGKRFTLRTLISTFMYPAFLTLFMRTGVCDFFKNVLPEPIEISILLCSILGGILTGFGIALTFLGDGSTGGLDILAFILNKYLKIKVSIATFLFDFIVILTGIIVSSVNGSTEGLFASLSGILTALVSAAIIHFVYVGSNSIYVADIVTEKEFEISEFVHKNLDRTTTIFNGVGSYSKKNVKVVRIVFEKRELIELRDAVAKIDPKAFITIYPGNNVFGEGFAELKPIFIDNFEKQSEKKKKKK